MSYLMQLQGTKFDIVADDLSPTLAKGLRAAAVAGQEFEPFVAQVVDASSLSELLTLGLVEEGVSRRPTVSRFGHRLSLKGWEMLDRVWYCQTLLA